MTKEQKIVLALCAVVLAAVGVAVCVLIVVPGNTQPAAPTQQIQGEEGIDWEDCLNNEPDCFLGRRRIPTTAARKTPAPAATGKTSTTKPATVRTGRR